MSASQQGHTEIVELLLNHNANVNAKSEVMIIFCTCITGIFLNVSSDII